MEAGRGGKTADRLAGLRFDARQGDLERATLRTRKLVEQIEVLAEQVEQTREGSSVSDWTGCEVRTVWPRASARARISDQTVVLPIPGSPSSTSVAEPPSSASRNRSPAARSSSRPITPGRLSRSMSRHPRAALGPQRSERSERRSMSSSAQTIPQGGRRSRENTGDSRLSRRAERHSVASGRAAALMPTCPEGGRMKRRLLPSPRQCWQ